MQTVDRPRRGIGRLQRRGDSSSVSGLVLIYGANTAGTRGSRDQLAKVLGKKMREGCDDSHV